MLTPFIQRKYYSLFLALWACQIAFAADPLSSAIDTRVQGQQESIATQRKVDDLADQTQSMLQQYRTTNNHLSDLRVYNDQLERLVASQKEQLASLDRQTKSVVVTNRKIVPLMIQMVDVLGRFISQDTPFLGKERSERFKRLKAMLDRADVPLPEKYRRILEAYQIEADYGRTIEAYTGERRLDGHVQAVDFLRLGRVALYFASLDGKETGYWDNSERSWKTLPKSYNRAINQGIRVARSEIPPDMIGLPLPAPEKASEKSPKKSAIVGVTNE